jgi:His-Xaa-Ser system protein HxsD
MVVSFHSSTSTPEAVAKAAYRMAPKAQVYLTRITEDALEVEIEPKTGQNLEVLTSELRDHINDYFLRDLISRKTEGVRTLLLAQAFSSVVSQLKNEPEPQ